MSKERPQQHPQESAEGTEEAQGAPGAERAGDNEGTQGESEERPAQPPQEPAEGAEEAPGAERAGEGR